MKMISNGIAALLVTASVTYAADADPTRKEMLKELIQLNKHLSSLEKKIDELSKKSIAGSPRFVGADHQPRGADRVLLSKIKYPEKATKENLKKYIKEIQDACRNQNSFSSDDPQVKMLEKVGHENIELLMDALTAAVSQPMSMQCGQTYLENAITKLVGPGDKELVIKMLPKNQNMISAVIKYGWEKDAKEVIINKIKYSQYVPHEFIQAVAGFRDPSTYPFIRSYFVKNGNPEMIYPYIKDLPIDFDAAINEAWTAATFSNELWRLRQMAPLALENGNVDAFEYLLDYIQTPKVNQYELPKLCFLVKKYSGKDGSTEEISQWVKKNRKQLYFDKKAKKFKVGPEKK